MEHPLRTYRTRAGLSIEAMARRVSASSATISRIETGLQRPSFDLLQRLTKETGISADEFLAYQPPEPPDIHRRGLRDLGSEASPKQAANG